MARKKNLKRKNKYWLILGVVATIGILLFAWRGHVLKKREFLLKTRPCLTTISKQEPDKDLQVFIKNTGGIPVIRISIRRKILFEWTDEKGLEQRWLRPAHGDSTSSLGVGEVKLFGKSTLVNKETIDLFLKGVRIEEYLLISYRTYENRPFQDAKVEYLDLSDPTCRNANKNTANTAIRYEGPLENYPYKERFIQDDKIPIYDYSNIRKILQEVERKQ